MGNIEKSELKIQNYQRKCDKLENNIKIDSYRIRTYEIEAFT